MRSLNVRQLKVLADFLNYIAVAWFTGGVITPILTGPESFWQNIKIPIGGTMMTIIFLYFSLAINKKSAL